MSVVVTRTNRNGSDAWKVQLTRVLPLLGHRNWIVVADSAYPAQSNHGIETIATGADHFEVLQATLAAVEASTHVRADIYLDAELDSVYERDAPGVSRYRRRLAGIIENLECNPMLHDQIIAELDKSAQLFRILILKTTLAIPYTSIFIRLECGYWTSNAEDRLRHSIATHKARTAILS